MSAVRTLIGDRALADSRDSFNAAGKLREAILALAGGGRVILHSEHAWRSPTFSGTRHSLGLVFEAGEIDGAERMFDVLPSREFSIPGQLVADAGVVGIVRRYRPAGMTCTIEVLLLEED